MPQSAYARSNGIHHPAPGAYAASHPQPNGFGQPNGYRPSPSPYLQSPPAGVMTSSMKPSMKSQQEQMHQSQRNVTYDPHQNGFSRPPPPSTFANTATTPSNVQQVQASNGGQARDYASPHASAQFLVNSTPYANGKMPNMASSPTPSLSATQGQTCIRFSPSGQGTSANSHAYVPNDNQPAPSAYSPMKHASPPAAHARNSSNSNGHAPLNSQTSATRDLTKTSHSPVMGPRAPTLESSSPKAPAAGISPIKHDAPSQSSPNSMSRQADDLPTVEAQNYCGTVSTLPLTKQHPLSSPLPPASGGPSLAAAPALEPTVGTENCQGKALQPPVKRA